MQGQTLGRSVARKERLTDWDENGKELVPGMEEGARRHWRGSTLQYVHVPTLRTYTYCTLIWTLCVPLPLLEAVAIVAIVLTQHLQRARSFLFNSQLGLPSLSGS